MKVNAKSTLASIMGENLSFHLLGMLQVSNSSNHAEWSCQQLSKSKKICEQFFTCEIADAPPDMSLGAPILLRERRGRKNLPCMIETM
jgi:hypothetical protein